MYQVRVCYCFGREKPIRFEYLCESTGEILLTKHKAFWSQ
jgi:hypothetical protein